MEDKQEQETPSTEPTRVFNTRVGVNPYRESVAPEAQEDNGSSEENPSVAATADTDEVEQGGEETFVEEGEYDPDSPEYKHFLSAYTRKRQKDTEKLRALEEEIAKLKGQGQATPTEAEGTSSGDDLPDDPYVIKFDGFTPEIPQAGDDSSLGGIEAEVAAIVNPLIQQHIGHVMSQLRYKNEAAEKQTKVSQARDTILAYESSIRDHPDFEAKSAELMEAARGMESLALSNPEKFISALEAVTGLRRDWSEPATKTNPKFVGNKAKAATPRTTRTRISNAPKRADMTLDDAIDAAMGFR